MQKTAYVKKSIFINGKGGIKISAGTRVYVDLDINPDGDRAQVVFPSDNPEFAGSRTIMPKKNLLIDSMGNNRTCCHG